VRVGLHLAYKANDLGYTAIRLAEFFQTLGHDVTFHSTCSQVSRVHPRWDRQVMTERTQPFTSWVSGLQALVALEPFSPEYFAAAAKAWCRIVLLAPWDTLQESLVACYKMADVVVSPVQQGVQALREFWSLKQARYIPWDNGLPITRKPRQIDPLRVKVLVPMHGWQAGSTSPAVLNVIWHVLHQCPFVDITLVYGAKSFNTSGFKAIRAIGKTFGASGQFRATSDSGITRDDLLMLYGRHDLTVWASEQEGLGCVGLDSLTMGTPVIAWDVAPQNEFLSDQKNSVLVPCQLKYNLIGVPWVTTDTNAFETRLIELLHDTDLLSDLRRFTRYGLAARRDKFSSGWKDALTPR
jgi:hypothetical protein